MQVQQNLFYEFCGLDPLGTLALVDTATLSCFNHDYLRIFTQAPCLFMNLYNKLFSEEHIHSIGRNYHLINMMETRPLLIVVSSFFGGNPFDGEI
jgi:hypothetical protein